MNLKALKVSGHIFLKSSLSLEDMGEIISEKVFGGLKFGGKELEIYEEVPAIFIQSPIMGLKIILDQYIGEEEIKGFNLSIEQWDNDMQYKAETIKIDQYLFHLLKSVLKDVEDIEVLED